MKPKVSIIIRAKNEERWISACLRSVFSQSFRDFEVIVVDNSSTDKTVKKARQFGMRIINIDEYLPGRAINAGIKASRGEYIAILSAHCVPKGPEWLAGLMKNLEEDKKGEIAGVYGRQEPLSFTSDLDKRDLHITFGLDRKVQIKDSFFHNANSMVRRSVVDLIPFDSEVTNIEDRLWAKEAIKRGYKLVYEPDASVFHYHGIHQSADPARARDVVCIMESRDTLDEEVGGTEQLDLNIVAIITAKGDPVTFCGRPLIEYTMQRAKESAFLKKIIVSTDSEKTRRLAAGAGINAPFLRPPEFSRPGVGVEEVLKYSLAQIEENGEFPDAVVYLSIMQPFRPIILIDELISLFLKKGFDSVMAGYPVYKPCWIEKEGRLNRVDEGFMPRDEKNPVHVGYAGLACVTYPEFLMQGKLLGDNVGIFEVLDHYSTIDVKSPSTFELAEKVFLRWWNSQNKTCRDGGRSAEKGVRTSK